jgi:hypothetical protein
VEPPAEAGGSSSLVLVVEVTVAREVAIATPLCQLTVLVGGVRLAGMTLTAGEVLALLHFPNILCVEARETLTGFTDEVSTTEEDTNEDDTTKHGV